MMNQQELYQSGERGFVCSRLRGFTPEEQALFTVHSVRTSNCRHSERRIVADCRKSGGLLLIVARPADSLRERRDNIAGSVRVA